MKRLLEYLRDIYDPKKLVVAEQTSFMKTRQAPLTWRPFDMLMQLRKSDTGNKNNRQTPGT